MVSPDPVVFEKLHWCCGSVQKTECMFVSVNTPDPTWLSNLAMKVTGLQPGTDVFDVVHINAYCTAVRVQVHACFVTKLGVLSERQKMGGTIPVSILQWRN